MLSPEERLYVETISNLKEEMRAMAEELASLRRTVYKALTEICELKSADYFKHCEYKPTTNDSSGYLPPKPCHAWEIDQEWW